jgi:hypothetical protein
MSRFTQTCSYIYSIARSCFNGLKGALGFTDNNLHPSDQSEQSSDGLNAPVTPVNRHAITPIHRIAEENDRDFTDVELEVERPDPLHIPHFHTHQRTGDSIIAHGIGEVTGHVIKLSQAAAGIVTSPLSPQSIGSTIEAAFDVATASVSLAGDVTTVAKGYNVLGESQTSNDSSP